MKVSHVLHRFQDDRLMTASVRHGRITATIHGRIEQASGTDAVGRHHNRKSELQSDDFLTSRRPETQTMPPVAGTLPA